MHARKFNNHQKNWEQYMLISVTIDRKCRQAHFEHAINTSTFYLISITTSNNYDKLKMIYQIKLNEL
jgi:hypothetical protein